MPSQPPFKFSKAFAAKAPPVQVRVAKPAAKAPPVQVRVAKPAAKAPPAQVQVAKPAAKTPPAQVRVAKPAAKAPPAQVRVAKPAAKAPPSQVRVAKPAAKAPPLFLKYVSKFVSKPPTKSNEEFAINSPTASYPAMPLVQNGQRFFLLSIPVSDLFSYCFVTRRLEDPIEGFQRSLSEERANAIARYLENSQGSIPTNVVLSAQPEALLVYNSGTKTIKFQRVPKAFLVLDGQHRLFGYSRTNANLGLRVPVAIYESLSRTDEAALFIDINTTQRGVPASLLLDIKQMADREEAHETALRYLFDGLNTHPSSPLNGRLSAAEAVRGKISRVTFNRGGKEVIDNNVLGKLGPSKQLELVRNYFCALEASLSEPELLFKSVYFEAFCALFGEALRLSFSRFQNYKQDSLALTLAPLKNVDISSLAIGGKTKLTKGSILPVLLTAVSGQVEVTDDMI